jgi:transposase
VALIQARTQANNRVVKELEETHITLTRVVSDRFGRRGRRLLAALVAGERAPKILAALALGVLQRQQPPRELARTGPCTDHHAWLIQGALERSARRDRQMAALDQHVSELMAPVAPQLEQLTSMPGVEATAARAILAEIGTEMRHCGSAARLASWTGVCPGHDASASKRRSGRTRQGHRDLRRVLGQCAWAARTPPTFLGHTFRRLEGRLGGKKAAMAVAHTMLVIVDHLRREGTCDEEARYDRLQDRQEKRQRKRAVKALERLG